MNPLQSHLFASLTDEQAAILDRFLNSEDSFRVEAPPGSGKTHLLTHMLLARAEPQMVCMFSATAQQTLARRLNGLEAGTQHRVSTLHSLAFRLTEHCWQALGFPHRPRHCLSNATAVVREADFETASIAERRERGVFTYNDALYYLLVVLREGFFRIRYPALLVDEYQDTNDLQWAIIEALLAQGPKRLVLLGDRYQCIYQFLQARADHPLAEALPALRLTWSHRCRSRVAQLAGCIVGERFDGPPGGLVQIHHYQRIAEFASLALRLLRQREARTSAVLCRTNRQCDSVRAFLASERVPVAGKTLPQAVQFWSHPAVTWALDFLENPLQRWSSALPYLGLSRNFTSLEALERASASLPSEEAARALQFVRAVQSMHDAPTVRDSLELVDFLFTFPADWSDHLWTLKRQAGQIRSHKDLLHLRNARVEPYRSPGVEVLTIHAAKGREWEHVIVDAGLPAGANWQEQKFAAYVAVTRAEQYVDVFCPYFGNSWDIDRFPFD